jgi:signal transduction histidine kinase
VSAETSADENPPVADRPVSFHDLPAGVGDSLLTGAWKETLSIVTLGFAHDLNNVLAGLLGMTEVILLESRPDDSVRDSLTQMKVSARQAAGLIEQLGALHRAKPGRREHHDLNNLVVQSLEFLRRAVPRRIEFFTEPSPSPLPVFVDAVQFQNLVASLVFAISRAIPKQGRLTLQTSMAEHLADFRFCAGAAPRLPAACFSIRADGAGGPVDLTQVPIMSRDTGSAGCLDLGLRFLSVRHFVESHDGGVSIEACDKSGSRVRVCLPIADFSESGPSRPG